MTREMRNCSIFDSTCKVIVNTVNCVGVMGKGLALEYKLRFPDMYTQYKKTCERNELAPGKLILYTKTTPWIMNFPTKTHWKLPSQYEYIELGLAKFASTYLNKGISSIAFPLLGTKSGGLDENKVLEIMYHYLNPLKNIDIEIYHYSPDSTDSMFDKLYQLIHRMTSTDLVSHIGLRIQEASKLNDAIGKKTVSTMLDIQQIQGYGEKSIKKLYDFLQKADSDTLSLEKEQLEIF